MVLSATFSINSDGLIEYEQILSGFSIPMGETGKLQLDVFNRAHNAISKAVAEVNGSLKADGLAERLASDTKFDKYGNVIAAGQGWTAHSAASLQHDTLAEQGDKAALGADGHNNIE